MTKEDFSPEHINDFFPAHEDIFITPTGSYYWFNGIDGFEPHDYDYVRLIKGEEYNVAKSHYMYMDVWDIVYDESKSKQDYINYIVNCARENHLGSAFLCILMKPICDHFGIVYEDIEPYIDEIIALIEEKTATRIKYKYHIKLVNFIKQNRSFELTSEQRLEVYEDYKYWKSQYQEYIRTTSKLINKINDVEN